MAQLAKQTAAEAARRAIRDATRELQRTYEMYGRDAGLPEAEIDHFTKLLKGEALRAKARQSVRDALELHKTAETAARSPSEQLQGDLWYNIAIAALQEAVARGKDADLPLDELRQAEHILALEERRARARDAVRSCIQDQSRNIASLQAALALCRDAGIDDHELGGMKDAWTHAGFSARGAGHGASSGDSGTGQGAGASCGDAGHGGSSGDAGDASLSSSSTSRSVLPKQKRMPKPKPKQKLMPKPKARSKTAGERWLGAAKEHFRRVSSLKRKAKDAAERLDA